jgi:hypothetical protein
VRLRTLVAVFVVLWLIWTWTKPEKFAERVEQAVTLASVCNTAEARKQLAALEADNASARQLERVRAALASAQPACAPRSHPRAGGDAATGGKTGTGTRPHAQASRRSETTSGVEAARRREGTSGAQASRRPESLFGTPAPRRAQSGQRAADVNSQYGSSGSRVAAGMAAPPTQASPSAQSARNLIVDARRLIAGGNYRAAIDRMEVCTSMLDTVPAECRTLRVHAEYLQEQMQACLARGAEWVGDRCEQ